MMGIFSANKKISKGRRELGRKFVRLDCADSLLSVAPTHLSLFGNSSVPEAVKQAKEATKADNTLVFVPKKKFRPSYTPNKGFQFQQTIGFKNQSQYQNQYQSQPYVYDNQYNSQRNQFQYKPKAPRGRGRGGRRGKFSNRTNNSNN